MGDILKNTKFYRLKGATSIGYPWLVWINVTSAARVHRYTSRMVSCSHPLAAKELKPLLMNLVGLGYVRLLDKNLRNSFTGWIGTLSVIINDMLAFHILHLHFKSSFLLDCLFLLHFAFGYTLLRFGQGFWPLKWLFVPHVSKNTPR